LPIVRNANRLPGFADENGKTRPHRERAELAYAAYEPGELTETFDTSPSSCRNTMTSRSATIASTAKQAMAAPAAADLSYTTLFGCSEPDPARFASAPMRTAAKQCSFGTR
jgi:hypothetical protein